MALESIEKTVAVKSNDLIGQIFETVPARPVYVGLNFDAFGYPFPNLACPKEVARYLAFCKEKGVSLNQADLVYCQKPEVLLPIPRNPGISTNPNLAGVIAAQIMEGVITPRRHGRVTLNLNQSDNITRPLDRFRKDWMERLTQEDYQLTHAQLWFIAAPSNDPYDKLQGFSVGLSVNSIPEATALRLNLGTDQRQETAELVKWFNHFSPSAE